MTVKMISFHHIAKTYHNAILFLSLIQIQDSVNIEMRDNAVAGSERFGYSIAGQMCSEDNWSNNVAHGVLSGKRSEKFPCCLTMTILW